MADFEFRSHLEMLLQISRDYAREQVIGELDLEQDMDLMPFIKGPVAMRLAASASATEITKPIGATNIRGLFVTDVEASSGVNVRIDGAANDPILVKPSTDNDTKGVLVLLTSATSVYVDNPSSTASVDLTVMLLCD